MSMSNPFYKISPINRSPEQLSRRDCVRRRVPTSGCAILSTPFDFRQGCAWTAQGYGSFSNPSQ
jgi:hypothetical protein